MDSSLDPQETEKFRRQAIMDLEELVIFRLLLGYYSNFELKQVHVYVTECYLKYYFPDSAYFDNQSLLYSHNGQSDGRQINMFQKQKFYLLSCEIKIED